jgi:hypothetical protein
MTQRVLIVDDGGGELATGGIGMIPYRRGIHSMQSFPLLAFSLGIFAICNMGADQSRPWYRGHAFSIHQMSGDVWQVSGGDLFLSVSMFLLFIEIIRATRSGGESLVNHALSCLVFIAALMLFLTRRGYGNSTFFIFMTMTLVDFMAGFIITAVASRRDTAIGRIGA